MVEVLDGDLLDESRVFDVQARNAEAIVEYEASVIKK